MATGGSSPAHSLEFTGLETEKTNKKYIYHRQRYIRLKVKLDCVYDCCEYVHSVAKRLKKMKKYGCDQMNSTEVVYV